MPNSNLYASDPFGDEHARPGYARGLDAPVERQRTGETTSSSSSAVNDAVSDPVNHGEVHGDVGGLERHAALRALRSLEATEARLTRNAQREVDEAKGKLVQDILPVLDNLDRTLRAAHEHRADPAMLEGVRLVRQQLEGVLRGYGLERVEAMGQRFDPNLHEAIGVTQVGEPARHGVVVQQAEPGYRLGGRMLRPAKVSVGKLAAPAYAQAPARPYWR